MKRNTLITLATASLILTACAGSDDTAEQAPETPATAEQAPSGESQPAQNESSDDFNPMDGFGIMQAGKFDTYSLEGGHIEFELPTEPTGPEFEAIEQFRTEMGVDPVTYVVADADNREGTGPINMYAISVFDEDGKEYEFQKLEMAMYEWTPVWTFDDETYEDEYYLPDETPITEEEYSRLSDMEDEITENLTTSVDAAGRDSIILVYEGDDLPTEFTRVAVWPNGGFDSVEAFPVQ